MASRCNSSTQNAEPSDFRQTQNAEIELSARQKAQRRRRIREKAACPGVRRSPAPGSTSPGLSGQCTERTERRRRSVRVFFALDLCALSFPLFIKRPPDPYPSPGGHSGLNARQKAQRARRLHEKNLAGPNVDHADLQRRSVRALHSILFSMALIVNGLRPKRVLYMNAFINKHDLLRIVSVPRLEASGNAFNAFVEGT